MAKGQTASATNMSNQLFNEASTLMQPVIQGFQSDRSAMQGNQAQELGLATSGYQQQQVTGGYNPQQLGMLRSQFQNWAPTGGMDPTQLAAINAGYGNLATTGGYTPGMEQQFLNQATSGTRNTADALSAAAQRNAAATGGNAQAAIANIQSELGGQQATATQNAMLGLNQQETANRLQGLGGLAGVQGQLQSGRAAIGGLQSGLESGVAQGVQGANAGLSNLYGISSQNVNQLGNQVLQGLGLQFGTQANAAQIMQQLSKNPGLFSSIMGGLEQAGGAAAGAAMGFGSAGII